MDTCEFSFIGQADSEPKYVLGIEYSWDELKAEFGRSGPGYIGATYFKTISSEGPQLFAVVNDDTVFYHSGDKWHRYMTAKDIRFGMLYSKDLNPTRAKAGMNYLDNKEWVIIPRATEISFSEYFIK